MGILAIAVFLVAVEGVIFRALAIWAFPDDDATEEAD